MRTITREEWERIPNYRKRDGRLVLDQSGWHSVKIIPAACDPKYLPQEKKMPINMTVKEWEAVPEYWRSSRMRSELHADPNYSQVFLTDDSEGRPHGSVHLEYWRNKGKAVQAITIAVWADGVSEPIAETPQEHAERWHKEGSVPEHYDTYKLIQGRYERTFVRAVEMRPVVLP